MKSILGNVFSLLLILTLAVSLNGCGGETTTGHVDDETPGGEATPPMDEMMDDAAMDDYAAEQEAAAD